MVHCVLKSRRNIRFAFGYCMQRSGEFLDCRSFQQVSRRPGAHGGNARLPIGTTRKDDAARREMTLVCFHNQLDAAQERHGKIQQRNLRTDTLHESEPVFTIRRKSQDLGPEKRLANRTNALRDDLVVVDHDKRNGLAHYSKRANNPAENTLIESEFSSPAKWTQSNPRM